jgi:hypothetical protein
MKTKLINQTHEIYDFAKTYEMLSGNQIASLTYLQNAKVRAFYNNQGEIIAGYAVSTTNMNPSLRYLDFLDIQSRNAILKMGYELNSFVEITFTFISKNKVGLFENMLVLILSIFDALSENKKYVIGGGVIPKFNARMKNVLKNVLFDDKVEVNGIDKNFQILYEYSAKLPFNLISATFREFVKLVF